MIGTDVLAVLIIVAVAVLSGLAWLLGRSEFDWFSERVITVDVQLVKAGRIIASDGDREYVFKLPPRGPARHQIRDGDSATLIGRRRMRNFVISRVRLDSGQEIPVLRQ